jgi:prevent-host-death family protein
MSIIDILNAKAHLSQLVQQVESGATTEIIIARNGKPAARLVPIGVCARSGKRLGLLEGRYPPVRKRNSTPPTRRSLTSSEGRVKISAGGADRDLARWVIVVLADPADAVTRSYLPKLAI